MRGRRASSLGEDEQAPATRRRRKGIAVEVLYSLYDALVSIKVPADNARAVVGALERDMSNTLATKADLQVLRQELTAHTTTLVAGLASRDELKSEIASLRGELKAEINSLRSELKAEISSLRSELKAELNGELSAVRGEMKTFREELKAEFRSEMAHQSNSLMLRLGSLMLVLAGLLFGAMRYL